MDLLAALKHLAEHPPEDTGVGICSSLLSLDVGHVDIATFCVICKRWPEHSGHPQYPVPGGVDAYHAASHHCGMWDAETEYGAARRRLVLWAIEQLEAQDNGGESL